MSAGSPMDKASIEYLSLDARRVLYVQVFSELLRNLDNLLASP